MDFFPFDAFGFRCNPFRSLTRQEWVDLAVLPDTLPGVLEQGFTHLQILGEKGAGKTTSLLALQAHLEAQGRRTAYEYLAEGQSRFLSQPDHLEDFFLDEVQRLSHRQRRRLTVYAGAPPAWGWFIWRSSTSASPPGLRLVLGSHEDLTGLFSHWGLPLQTVVIQNNPGHLAQVVRKRLAYFSLEGDPPTVFADAALDWLCRHFNGDYRAILDCLYDLFQAAVVDHSLPARITAEQARTAVAPHPVQE